MLEAEDFQTGSPDAAPIIDGRILEDTHLETVSQLEELAARSHVYEAICSHLFRERIPLQVRRANQPEL